MDFLQENELRTNTLVVKALWGIYFGGFAALIMLNLVGMAETAPMDIAKAMAGALVFF